MPITSITTTKNIVSNTDYVFKFGKHKGETVEDILNCDPGYILWMDENCVMKFSTEIYNQAELNDREDYGSDYPSWREIPF